MNELEDKRTPNFKRWEKVQSKLHDEFHNVRLSVDHIIWLSKQFELTETLLPKEITNELEKIIIRLEFWCKNCGFSTEQGDLAEIIKSLKQHTPPPIGKSAEEFLKLKGIDLIVCDENPKGNYLINMPKLLNEFAQQKEPTFKNSESKFRDEMCYCDCHKNEPKPLTEQKIKEIGFKLFPVQIKKGSHFDEMEDIRGLYMDGMKKSNELIFKTK